MSSVAQAEVVAAMQDPRYDNDPAYRNDVFQKAGSIKSFNTNDLRYRRWRSRQPLRKRTTDEIMDVTETHNEKAEKLNGRFAMLGVIAALGAYALTGQIIPGIW